MREAPIGREPRTMEPTSVGEVATVARWLQQLREHCLALSRLSPEVVSSLSLTMRLPASTVADVDLMQERSGRLAAEFGLVAALRLRGNSVSVRLTRESSWLDPHPECAR